MVGITKELHILKAYEKARLHAKIFFLVTILKFFQSLVVSQRRVGQENALGKSCCPSRVLSDDMVTDDVTSGFRLPVSVFRNFDPEDNFCAWQHGVYSESASKARQYGVKKIFDLDLQK